MSKDLNHYVNKSAILRSIVDGIPAKALCGELVDCQSQGDQSIPGNEAAHRELQVCPACQLFYSALREDIEEKIGQPA